MYCSIHANGDDALEDLSLAEKMICQRLTGKSDGEMCLGLRLIQVEYLLRLSFKYFAPRNDVQPSNRDGVMYVNPPTESEDYDDAYHEAKRLFSEIFGQEEEFLMRDEGDDMNADEE